MNIRTVTVTVSADRDTVFAFLSEIENLPLWARESVASLWHEGPRWKARTPIGESHVALCSDARTGVIDLLMGEQPDELSLQPVRVVTQPHGAAVTMTLFQT